MRKHFTFNNIVLVFVGVIALAAFVLSFNTISKLGNAFFPERGWVFAGMVDLAMIVLGMVRVQAGRMENVDIKRWSLVGLVVAGLLSVLMNVVTTDGAFSGQWLHYVIHGLPPVALLTLSELALSMYDASRSEGVDMVAVVTKRAMLIIGKLRKSLASKRQELEIARQEIGNLSGELGKKRGEVVSLRKERVAIAVERDELKSEVAQLAKKAGKLEKQLGKDYIQLAKLPERVAYVAQVTAKGMVPNGDMAEKFGLGVPSVDRAMSFLWPKQDRVN